MRRLGIGLLALVALAGWVPTLRAATGPIWNAYMIPGAAHLPGALGTFWRTDLSIVNPYTYKSITVTVAFLEELRDNSSQPRVTVSIPAKGQVLLEDVVLTKFGKTAKGALWLWTSDDSYFFTTARTYTGGAASYGQNINGQAWVNPGTGKAVITGVRSAGQYRANVGAVNWSNRAVSIRFDAYDAAGVLVGSRTFNLPPYGTEQVSLLSFASQFASGYLRLTGLSANDSEWIAYASVVDNATGDAVFLEERADDVFTERVPSNRLSGYWSGWLTTANFSELLKVNLYQYGAYVTAFLYDSTTGFRVASADGYEEAGQVVFAGRSNVFQYLGDTFQGTALVQSGGSVLSGTFTGTGAYAEGGTITLSKQASYAPREPSQSAASDGSDGAPAGPSRDARGYLPVLRRR
ncbi:MAG: hypothetical protein HXY19_04590 [Thermoanaerobaculaceae bacterium]|nr:hypothetical protein [Thermoanaerobaculaceae bacterium]